jgi:hypothetical protein
MPGFRLRYRASGNKTDPDDAFILADVLASVTFPLSRALSGQVVQIWLLMRTGCVYPNLHGCV